MAHYSHADNGVLRDYLSSIRSIPHLKQEEELDLATRMREGDIDARDKLVRSHLYLVYQIVRKYPSRKIAVFEQLQEGNLGLLHAARKFEPERGIRFASYAKYWIRAYVLSQLVADFRLVRIGTSVRQRKLFFQLGKTRDAIEREGLEATPERIAERLDVPVADVAFMETRMGSNAELSLDFKIDGERPITDTIVDASPDVESLTAHKELRNQLQAAIDDFSPELSERERSIWEQRMLNDSPLSLRKLGASLGLSRERVRQIESGLLTRLREQFDKRQGMAIAC